MRYFESGTEFQISLPSPCRIVWNLNSLCQMSGRNQGRKPTLIDMSARLRRAGGPFFNISPILIVYRSSMPRDSTCHGMKARCVWGGPSQAAVRLSPVEKSNSQSPIAGWTSSRGMNPVLMTLKAIVDESEGSISPSGSLPITTKASPWAAEANRAGGYKKFKRQGGAVAHANCQSGLSVNGLRERG